MSEQCCGTSSQVMILACSGGSNVGQIANQAAVELTREGRGKMFCLVGIGGGLSGFVRSAKDVSQMVLVDGCEVCCGKKALEREGVPVRNHLILTELGIAKNKNFALPAEDIARVKQEICRLSGEETEAAPAEGSRDVCCG